MGVSEEHYQQWRENAAWQGNHSMGDCYTALWAEMVKAYKAHMDSLYVPGSNQSTGYSHGLVKAYCLITGDSSTSVYRMLAKAVAELVPS